MTDNNCPKLDVSNLKIYIGGNTKSPAGTVNNIYIKNLSITDYPTAAVAVAEAVALPEITEPETVSEPVGDFEPETIAGFQPLVIAAEEPKVIATYSLTNNLDNSVDPYDPATFVYQFYEENAGTKIESLPVEPTFTDDGKALSVKATSHDGAVSLDAVPVLDEDGFTISMELQRTNNLKNKQQNIFYLSDKNKNKDYYQYFRSVAAAGYLGITKGVQQDFTGTPSGTDMVYYKGGMADNNWYTNTLVFKPDKTDSTKMIITPYINGKPEYQDKNVNTSIASISVNKSDLVFLLGALKSNGDNSNQYLDDLYVFDKALDAETVKAYFSDESIECKAGLTHARSVIEKEDGTTETIDIAQINKELAENSYEKRRAGTMSIPIPNGRMLKDA